MLAKITNGKDCKYRLWQEDSYVEFDDAWGDDNGIDLIEIINDMYFEKATIKGSSAKEFLRCFEIVKGDL